MSCIRRHAPYRDDRGHQIAIELLIEAVQRPAAPAGEHRPTLLQGQIAEPGQHQVSLPSLAHRASLMIYLRSDDNRPSILRIADTPPEAGARIVAADERAQPRSETAVEVSSTVVC